MDGGHIRYRENTSPWYDCHGQLIAVAVVVNMIPQYYVTEFVIAVRDHYRRITRRLVYTTNWLKFFSTNNPLIKMTQECPPVIVLTSVMLNSEKVRNGDGL